MSSILPNSTVAADPVSTRRSIRTHPGHGFSILELMIALFVLLFGFITMINLIAAGIVVNRSSNRLTSLTQLASEKLEELRALDINDPRLIEGGALDNNVTADKVDRAGVGHTVSYFDAVFVDQRTGTVIKTSAPDDSGNFRSQTTTLDGTNTSTPSGEEPTQVSFVRRWLIESNQPIAGATRITVEVAVKTNKLSDPDPSGMGYRQVIRMRAVR